MSNIYLGCAIWGYRPWVGAFLPARTGANAMLRAYAGRLTTVEINATFYAVPDAATVARWVQDTPPGFRFCPKVPQAVSHGGALAPQVGAAQAFVERMRGLGARLGPIFLQLPPAYGPANLADLTAWLDAWPAGAELAVEVRHRGWFAPAAADRLNGILRERGIGRVLVDVRPINTGATTDQVILDARRKKPNVPLIFDRTAQASLVRFMGHPDLAIDQPLLGDWADYVERCLTEGTTVYVFMHCPVEDQSPLLCERFAELLVGRGLPDPLPPKSPPSVGPPEQMSLL